MTSLLLIDLDQKDRLKRVRELDTIFRTVVVQAKGTIGAERCSLFLIDHENKELWTKVQTSHKEIIRLPLDDASIVGHVALTGNPCSVVDAYASEYFNPDV